MTDTVEQIRAYVEGYCGTRVNPYFSETVDNEINERLAKADARIKELEDALKWILGYVHNYAVFAQPKDGESVIKRKCEQALTAARDCGIVKEET